MSTITIELDTGLAYRLAISREWAATIEDTASVVDESVVDIPMIENPQTHEEFLAAYIPIFIKEYMLNAGKQSLLLGFESKLSIVNDAVLKGSFDEQILAGDTDGINEIVKAML